MVKTNSMFVELGTKLDAHEMLNVNSEKQYFFNFKDLDNRHLFLMFICAHCPFVKHLEKQISTITSEIQDNIQTIAISSNDILAYPADSPINLKKQAETNNWNFPYLYDSDQTFAKKLKAACTPDFYLYSNKGNSEFSLYYHGQFDKSRPSNNLSVTGEDLLIAVNALINNLEPITPQIPSLGCNIKWKPGGEPEWFK